MADARAISGRPRGPQQRHIRNYLLDWRFQLRYAAYFAGIAVVLSLALGSVLWVTSQRLVGTRWQLVERGRAVVAEGMKVSEVVEMNIVKDPVYAQDAELLKLFKEGDQQYAKRLTEEQAQLESDASALAEQSKMLWWVLVAALSAFVITVAVAGILVTHRVAGPVYKMKRQLNEVAAGKLRPPGSLRKGDELVDFFLAFDSMLRALRETRQGEIQALDRYLNQMQNDTNQPGLQELRLLKERMQASLDV